MKGSERRMFMARIVNALGREGQVWVERELGWWRDVIHKGQWELENGPIEDNVATRGRKCVNALDHDFKPDATLIPVIMILLLYSWILLYLGTEGLLT